MMKKINIATNTAAATKALELEKRRKKKLLIFFFLSFVPFSYSCRSFVS